MADFVIPCDTVARLSNVLTDFHQAANEWFKSIRIDNGVAVATNRIVMAIENIGGPSGIFHLIADPTLIAQCRTEAPFGSALAITVNEALKFAVAKTTLGYVHPTNCGVWSDQPNEFNRWRQIAAQASVPAKKPKGAMFWDADNIARLAASSPSGRVVFEEIVDCGGRPTVIRDINEPNWCGLFNPFSTEHEYAPATLPSWMM